MRFLCFHGMGTNSKIFEAQTARLRLSLGGEHEYIFIDGSIPTPAAPGMPPFRPAQHLPPSLAHTSEPRPLALTWQGLKELVPNNTGFFRYAVDNDLTAALEMYTNIEEFVTSEGPFDGMMGFSEGAGVGASLLAYQEKMADTDVG
ncbi:hypothetical protein OPT61_g1937 [Boeremia exigua]|uniref:Uncharacterized protein n=1 Tax=Boeremia exigua TaxID=749465 RepID=A0ACC2INJ2_9PLEO|nr:hypothetical protein OPT61_g1937 [Boeremia exigua]